MSAIVLLQPEDPPERFPDPAQALENPEGLLAIGGDLSPERLLAAYRRGIFPWYEEGQPILWWSPDPRAILVPREFHVSRSLQRTLRRNRYTVSVDTDFRGVITACAKTRAEQGTWITADMQNAYLRLHELGYAHSVETWRADELVGGVYGIAIGRMFFGESMFSTAADASKVALVHLAQLLEALGIELIDCQMATGHLASLGSRMLARSEFLAHVTRLTAAYASGGSWRRERCATERLVRIGGPPAPLHG